MSGTQETALTLARELSGAGEAEEALLELLCQAAEQQWEKRLRPGMTTEDCGKAFPCAVAFTAAADLAAARGGEGVSGFTAYLVPHQANLRIIDATAKRMGLGREKCMINIDRNGNTTAATIPLCLYEYEAALCKGDNLILASFGGGYTWGSIYVKWAYDGENC